MSGSAGEVFARGASDPRHVLGVMAEELIARHLKDRGFIVFRDWRKHVAESGLDLAAYVPSTKPGETGWLWHIDNKAHMSRVPSPSALVGPQYAGYARDLKDFVAQIHPNRAEGELALRAIEENRVLKVVSNALAGEAAPFSRRCFDNGLHVYDIRMGQLFGPSEREAWRNAHVALSGRKGIRTAGARGAATRGSLLVIAAVGAGVLLIAQAGEDIKQQAIGLAADSVLDALLSRLPGGFIAASVISLESDQSPAARQAQKREETIDELIGQIRGLTPEESKESRIALGRLLDQPVVLDAEPESPQFLPSPRPAAARELPSVPPPRIRQPTSFERH